MNADLTGRVCLVTGASRGLGAAIAQGYAAAGATVVAAARSADQLAAVVASDPARISAVPLDLTDPESLAPAVETVLDRHGRIDVLVNNAGIAPAGALLDQDPAVWRTTFEVNVLAPMRLAQLVGRQLVGQRHGKVVNVASTTGLRGKPQLAGYSAAKAALVRLTEALAAEWAEANVQVNAIAPGAFRTDAQAAVTDSPELLARRVRRIPARRMAEPAEIVPLACLLASAGSDFITGAVFVIDGGEVAKL